MVKMRGHPGRGSTTVSGNLHNRKLRKKLKIKERGGGRGPKRILCKNPPTTGRQHRRLLKAFRLADKVKKKRYRLQRGIVRRGDQWAGGKKTYKNIRPYLPSEYSGRYLAVADGGVDLVSEDNETLDSFQQRVEKLVKPYIIYTPYIVKHMPLCERTARLMGVPYQPYTPPKPQQETKRITSGGGGGGGHAPMAQDDDGNEEEDGGQDPDLDIDIDNDDVISIDDLEEADGGGDNNATTATKPKRAGKKMKQEDDQPQTSIHFQPVNNTKQKRTQKSAAAATTDRKGSNGLLDIDPD